MEDKEREFWSWKCYACDKKHYLENPIYDGIVAKCSVCGKKYDVWFTCCVVQKETKGD